MSEIKILPIFNQSAPGVWDDMLRVRIAAMQHNYNIHLTDEELADAMSVFQKSWRQLSHNFAFAAYDGDRMVGCLNGDVQKKTAYVRHLYVLPEYQGQQIGAGLLRAAENAASLFARQTDVVALARAEKFYRHMGYNSPTNTNNYVKQLCAPKCRTVPVFYCAPSFVRACDKLMGKSGAAFNATRINHEHVPTFADYDVNSQLRTLGVVDCANGSIHSNNRCSDDWACRSMQRVIDNYLAHQK